MDIKWLGGQTYQVKDLRANHDQPVAFEVTSNDGKFQAVVRKDTPLAEEIAGLVDNS